ncbi:Fe2OG dioxygenase domain-containing protein [Psidium guajava]|nr:Fe2OG dioxygenase domain-containing protein [Psidium guajava]
MSWMVKENLKENARSIFDKQRCRIKLRCVWVMFRWVENLVFIMSS